MMTSSRHPSADLVDTENKNGLHSSLVDKRYSLRLTETVGLNDAKRKFISK